MQEVEVYIQASREKELETLCNVECHRALQEKATITRTFTHTQHQETMPDSLDMRSNNIASTSKEKLSCPKPGRKILHRQ